MFTLIILIITSLVQIGATFAVVKLIRYSRTRVSWVLIGIAFIIMAVSQLLEVYNYWHSRIFQDLLNLYHWLNLVISVLMTIGIIQIGRLLRNLKYAEQQKSESEQRFGFIFNNTSDEIFLADFEGNIIEVNDEAVKKLGYTHEEMLKKNYYDFKTPKYAPMVEKNIALIRKNGQHVYETEHITKEGKVVSLEMSSRVVNYFGNPAILTIGRDISERLEIERKVAEAIIETEERERRRFAMDLHDNLAPLLSTIKLYADLLKKGKLKKMNPDEAVASIDELVDQAIVTTREISNNIMPSILHDFGLATAIRDFCSYVNNTQSLTVEFDASQYSLNRPGIEETILYQSVKELVNNTIKHSQASHVSIFLESHDDQVNLLYKDNGIGFNADEKLKEKTGMGLNNILNKVKTIRGLCLIKSNPGEGMSVLVTLRINPKN